MYEIGQLIVYGNEGVCRVEEIGTPKISGVDKHRDYYTLAPIYREGKVFTPVDSKVFMRPVISREEALALIDRIPEMTAEVYENSNLRFLNEHYQHCIQNYTCADLLQLIKDVRAKRRQMIERGKKLGLVDERYMKRAEEMLHGELAVALEMPREQVPKFISDTLGDAGEPEAALPECSRNICDFPNRRTLRPAVFCAPGLTDGQSTCMLRFEFGIDSRFGGESCETVITRSSAVRCWRFCLRTRTSSSRSSSCSQPWATLRPDAARSTARLTAWSRRARCAASRPRAAGALPIRPWTPVTAMRTCI